MGDRLLGQEVDGYYIKEVVGQGGMGTVYKAEDRALSRSVALKCLNPELADDEAFLRRFRREARAIARVNSPYIVQIYTLTETEIGLLIVMEYVDGVTLDQHASATETGWNEWLPLIKQMLNALRHAHETGVIHRDIKPQNILLSDAGFAQRLQVKMTDFGLAKVNRTGDPSQTVTQGVYGTLYYMSPEQVKGEGEIDHRTDIYSLGMTTYEVLAGRLPFDTASSEFTIMRTIVEGDLPELSAFSTQVPGSLRDIVMKALAKDPEERFQSAAQMLSAIRELDKSSDPRGATVTSTTASSEANSSQTVRLSRSLLHRWTEELSPDVTESLERIVRRGKSLLSRQLVWTGGAFITTLIFAWYFSVHTTAPNIKPRMGPISEGERAGSELAYSQKATLGDASEKANATKESLSNNRGENQTTAETDPQEKNSEIEPSQSDSSGDQARSAERDSKTQRYTENGPPDTQVTIEKTSDPGVRGSESVDQTGNGRSENPTATVKDIAPQIRALLNIEQSGTLHKRINHQVQKDRLIRAHNLEKFFMPSQCYLFLVKNKRVVAILGPSVENGRPNLLTGEKIESWRTSYPNAIAEAVLPITNSNQ